MGIAECIIMIAVTGGYLGVYVLQIKAARAVLQVYARLHLSENISGRHQPPVQVYRTPAEHYGYVRRFLRYKEPYLS